MRRTNINALMKMVWQYLNREIGYIDFVLNFPYEMEKRYQKAVKEDAEYADMMYYCLIECGTDRAEGMSDVEFRQLVQKQYDEMMAGIY